MEMCTGFFTGTEASANNDILRYPAACKSLEREMRLGLLAGPDGDWKESLEKVQIAEDMGVGIEHIPTAWDGIIPALLAGKFDVIISGMSITMKRNLTVNFTHPYANTGYILVGSTAMAKKKGLKTLEDYNSSDITIATRRASTGAIAAKKNFPKAKLIFFDDGTMGIQETANGKVDATTSTPPKAAYDIEKRGDKLFVVDKALMSPTREAFAVRKGDPDILNWFNNWIDNVKASGWLQERHAYWFTTREWADQLPD